MKLTLKTHFHKDFVWPFFKSIECVVGVSAARVTYDHLEREVSRYGSTRAPMDTYHICNSIADEVDEHIRQIILL